MHRTLLAFLSLVLTITFGTPKLVQAQMNQPKDNPDRNMSHPILNDPFPLADAPWLHCAQIPQSMCHVQIYVGIPSAAANSQSNQSEMNRNASHYSADSGPALIQVNSVQEAVIGMENNGYPPRTILYWSSQTTPGMIGYIKITSEGEKQEKAFRVTAEEFDRIIEEQ